MSRGMEVRGYWVVGLKERKGWRREGGARLGLDEGEVGDVSIKGEGLVEWAQGEWVAVREGHGEGGGGGWHGLMAAWSGAQGEEEVAVMGVSRGMGSWRVAWAHGLVGEGEGAGGVGLKERRRWQGGSRMEVAVRGSMMDGGIDFTEKESREAKAEKEVKEGEKPRQREEIAEGVRADLARQVFDEICASNSVLWNLMIDGYMRPGIKFLISALVLRSYEVTRYRL
ncbi:hypothetical protein NE237_014995 [Protea cynaroides]|uniref:Uncharacterized protein n=1 Tax=Protea cynaroides TaxID=273540 RepID=A0A9Q0QQT7_9MAGN|nr:hypothetical protein NE237_014995 [Protea cynaroides]